MFRKNIQPNSQFRGFSNLRAMSIVSCSFSKKQALWIAGFQLFRHQTRTKIHFRRSDRLVEYNRLPSLRLTLEQRNCKQQSHLTTFDQNVAFINNWDLFPCAWLVRKISFLKRVWRCCVAFLRWRCSHYVPYDGASGRLHDGLCLMVIRKELQPR